MQDSQHEACLDSGASRGAHDVTEQFMMSARARGMRVVEVMTT